LAPLTLAPTPQNELDVARQGYEAARKSFDQVIESLATAGSKSDEQVRSVRDKLAELTAAEAEFHNALRRYAQSLRDSSRNA
jgi:prefoldin subunit 5